MEQLPPQTILWNEQSVALYLKEKGFAKYSQAFIDNHITGDVLLELDYATLKDIGMVHVGDRATLLNLIKRLPGSLPSRTAIAKFLVPPTCPPSPPPPVFTPYPRADLNVKGGTASNKNSQRNSDLSISIPPKENHISPSPQHLKDDNTFTSPPNYQVQPPQMKLRSNNAGEKVFSPLVITPRTTSMPTKRENTAAGNWAPIAQDDDSSPRSASPHSPLHTLMNLGFMMGIDNDGSVKAKDKGDRGVNNDIMENHNIRSRCIRVHGINNQSHIIDVQGLHDAIKIREKIFLKFNIKDDEKKSYAIFARDFNANMVSLNDEELFQISKSPDNPLKAHLTIRKVYSQYKTEQQQEAANRQKQALLQSHKSNSASPASSTHTLHSNNSFSDIDEFEAFFSGGPKSKPNKKVFQILGVNPFDPSSPLNSNSASVNEALHGPISPRTMKSSGFTAGSLYNRRDIYGDPDRTILAPQKQSKKLTDFFGERPPDELIADQLEQFFPGIAVRQSQMLANFDPPPLAQSPQRYNSQFHDYNAAIPSSTPSTETLRVEGGTPSFSPTPSHSLPNQSILSSTLPALSSSHESQPMDIKTIVQAAMLNKRLSRLPTRYSMSRHKAVESISPRPYKATSGEARLRTAAPSGAFSDQPQHGTSETLKSGTPTFVNSVSASSSEEAESPKVLVQIDSTDNVPTLPTPPSPISKNPSSYTPSSVEVSAPAPTLGDPIKKSLTPITQWEQGKLIGQGAFGKVYLGLVMDTGEIVAVKQVVIGTDNDAEKRKREDALRRELELLKEMDHDNIVRYLGFEIAGNLFNVFLEYVSGGSVASCLVKFGKFDQELTRCITVQICFGLEYLHDRKIIHRDIKGANILIDSDGVAKISDFGISKKNEYQNDIYRRMTRMSMQGSVNWMAPEVAKGKGYSAKVDLWSLGCLVLEMLSGHQPWFNVRGNIIFLLGKGQSPPLPEWFSDESKTFIKLCFASDPEQRPTCTQLLTSHPFVRVDPTSFDFRGWFEHAEELRLAEVERRLAEEEDEDSSEESSGYDDDSEEGEDTEDVEIEDELGDEEMEMDEDDGEDKMIEEITGAGEVSPSHGEDG